MKLVYTKCFYIYVDKITKTLTRSSIQQIYKSRYYGFGTYGEKGINRNLLIAIFLYVYSLI